MPSQELSVTTTVDGTEYPTESVELVTDRYNTTAELKTDLVTESRPPEDADYSVDINGHTVFTGESAESTNKDALTAKVTGYDPIKQLKSVHVTATFNKAPISAIIGRACADADIAVTMSLPSVTTSADYTNTRADLIVDEMSKIGDAVWYVDTHGILHVEEDPDPTVFKLKYVLDTSAGKKTQPYRSVLVYGDSPASRDGGQNVYALLSSAPVYGTAGEGEPQYITTNGNIRTQEEANNVAQSIYKEFQKQAASGYVKIVGWARIRPLDVIEMPDRWGSTRYLVSGVTHTVDNDEGFVTKLECGGLIDSIEKEPVDPDTRLQ